MDRLENASMFLRNKELTPKVGDVKFFQGSIEKLKVVFERQQSAALFKLPKFVVVSLWN
jgi:hypothetical protein